MCWCGSSASAFMIAWRRGERAHEHSQVALPWVYTWPTSVCKCWKIRDSNKNPKLHSPQTGIRIHLIASELHPIDCIRFTTPNMGLVWKIPFAEPVSIVLGKTKKKSKSHKNSNQYIIVKWDVIQNWYLVQISLVIVCFLPDNSTFQVWWNLR